MVIGHNKQMEIIGNDEIIICYYGYPSIKFINYKFNLIYNHLKYKSKSVQFYIIIKKISSNIINLSNYL